MKYENVKVELKKLKLSVDELLVIAINEQSFRNNLPVEIRYDVGKVQECMDYILHDIVAQVESIVNFNTGRQVIVIFDSLSVSLAPIKDRIFQPLYYSTNKALEFSDSAYLLALIDDQYEHVSEIRKHHDRLRKIAQILSDHKQ